MIKAGKYSIEDKGFTTTTERVDGVSREVLVMELPGGITESALAAICAGPIKVLDDQGQETRSYAGPFRAVSHSLRLTRESTSGDVAALADRMAELEAELAHERSEKTSAAEELASLSQQLQALKSGADDPAAPAESGWEEKEVAKDGADRLP